MRADGAAFDQFRIVIPVLTVFVGMFAAIVANRAVAATIFIIGFAVLLPMFSILSGRYSSTNPETVDRWMDVAERAEELSDEDQSSETDPLETLRTQYARGEINEVEFERRVERLVATEEIPEYAIQNSDSTQEDTDTTEPQHSHDDKDKKERGLISEDE